MTLQQNRIAAGRREKLSSGDENEAGSGLQWRCKRRNLLLSQPAVAAEKRWEGRRAAVPNKT
jgi:hypothetical protein